MLTYMFDLGTANDTPFAPLQPLPTALLSRLQLPTIASRRALNFFLTVFTLLMRASSRFFQIALFFSPGDVELESGVGLLTSLSSKSFYTLLGSPAEHARWETVGGWWVPLV